MKSKPSRLVAILAAFVLSAAPAIGWANALVTLTDQSSEVRIDPNLYSTNDPNYQKGLFSWKIDGNPASTGQQLIAKQWYWYRIGNGPELSLENLGVPTVQYAVDLLTNEVLADRVNLIYQGSELRVTLSYLLSGTPAGSQSSILNEAALVENISGSALDVHLFQYSDFDLPTATANSLSVTADENGLKADQAGAQYLVDAGAIVAGRGTLAWLGRADVDGNLLASLNDGNPTTLNWGTTTASGNTNFAFEWDAQMPVGSSFTVSALYNVNSSPTVPVPAAAWMGLSTLGGLGLVRKARKLFA